MNLLKKIKIKCLVVGSGISTDFFLKGIDKKKLNKIIDDELIKENYIILN